MLEIRTPTGGYIREEDDGTKLLIRCPSCGRENWAPAVATGQCAWCGYDAHKSAIERAAGTEAKEVE